VGILAWGWDTHCTWPVVIEMRQLVRQLLEMVRLQARSVLDDIVTGRVHGALPNGLRHQEEVVPLRQGHHVVYYSPTGWVGRLSCHLEKSGVDPLADYDVGEQ